jgi:5-methylcytosine-specific restriction protein A
MVERLRGRAGVKQRDRRLQRTNYLCEMCLAEGRYVTADFVDHVKALAHGGTDDDVNTQNLCAKHHDLKTRAEFGLRPRKPQISLDGWPIEE